MSKSRIVKKSKPTINSITISELVSQTDHTLKVNRNYSSGKSRKTRYIVTGIVILAILVIIRILMIIAVRKPEKIVKIELIPVEASIAKLEKINDTINLSERLQPYSEVNVYSPVPGWLNELYVDIGSKVYSQQIVANINRNIVGSEYARAIVKSPISGEVGKIYADIGANISPASPILSVINYDTMKMYVAIPEKQIYHVQKGNKALISVESIQGETFLGEIKKLSSAIDPLTGTFQAKIEIKNKSHKLKPGVFADVKIIVEAKETVTVMQEAIMDLETTKPYMFVVITNTASRRSVKTGIQEQGKVEILEGIQNHDVYIITGVEIVKDGDNVRIVNADKLGLANIVIEKKTHSETNKKSGKKN